MRRFFLILAATAAVSCGPAYGGHTCHGRNPWCDSPTQVVTPEPATCGMIAAGLIALAVIGRRKGK